MAAVIYSALSIAELQRWAPLDDKAAIELGRRLVDEEIYTEQQLEKEIESKLEELEAAAFKKVLKGVRDLLSSYEKL